MLRAATATDPALSHACIPTSPDYREQVRCSRQLRVRELLAVLWMRWILGEKGQLSTRAGSATLGILLLQDLITIPFLVMLPLLEGDPTGLTDIVQQPPLLLIQELLPTGLKTMLYLGVLVLFGRFGLRRVFEVVAGTNSKDAFVALCILVVCGTAIATEHLGFGQTLGAFLAGVLLAETSFRNQVEADLKPFKGLLLGLFFLCTGASVDMELLVQRFPVVALLTIGLISVKFAITATSSRLFGLSESESIKVGLTLSQGGEFAFVLLELAKQLEVLPAELNSLLIIVVVMSMALTPFLAEWGDTFEEKELQDANRLAAESLTYEMVSASEVERRSGVVVLCGFNKASQMVTNMISSPLVGTPVPWIAFEFDPNRVRTARAAGLPVFFGDGSLKEVLHPAGVEDPLAFVLTQKSHLQMVEAAKRVKVDFPNCPVYALCRDMRCAADLKAQGAFVKVSSAQGGIALGDKLLRGIGTPDADLAFLEHEMMLAVKEKVRNAAKNPGMADSDLEVFVFDRAQGLGTIVHMTILRPHANGIGGWCHYRRSVMHDWLSRRGACVLAISVAQVREAQLKRAAAAAKTNLALRMDTEQTFNSARPDASFGVYADDISDGSSSEGEWDYLPSELSTSTAEDQGGASDADELLGAARPRPLSRPEMSEERLTFELGGVLKHARDLIVSASARTKVSASTSGAVSAKGESSEGGSLDEQDTEWAEEDVAEWRAERENRKAWEQLQRRSNGPRNGAEKRIDRDAAP